MVFECENRLKEITYCQTLTLIFLMMHIVIEYDIYKQIKIETNTQYLFMLGHHIYQMSNKSNTKCAILLLLVHLLMKM